jgi:flavin reductase (DIM6/NTAB) family NADH-FMN oxidoreductase RutF
VTIHTEHPFADRDPDPVRRFRGRLGGAVTLWTAGSGADRAGLTVSSLVVALGQPAHVVGLLDPDADLTEALRDTGRVVVQVLAWPDRQVAEAFAGLGPLPGGPFRAVDWEQTAWGPRLTTAGTWLGVELVEERELGWSAQVTCRIAHVGVADDPPAGALGHRRGRWLRLGSHDLGSDA